MEQFIEEGYTINVCTDIIEWAKEFYGMPDGAIIVNQSEVDNECMGFAQIDDKEIWVFVSKPYLVSDLKEIVSHEIGHIIELNHTINPDENDEELHEIKADYYMHYFMLTDKIINKIIEIVHDNT